MVGPKRDDDELLHDGALLSFLGHPRALPPPPPELLAEANAHLTMFRTIEPPISSMDRVCLAITRAALRRLPDGHINDHVTRAVRQALSLIAWADPEALIEGGLATREEFALVDADNSAALEIGVARSLRYRAWFADVLAMKRPRDKRDEAVQGLFCAMLPLPKREQIAAALATSAELVAAYHRGRSGECLIENADDLAAEMWESSPRNALQLRKTPDGSTEMQFDAFRVRDAFRGREWGAAAPATTVDDDLVRRLHEDAPVDDRLKPVSSRELSPETSDRDWEPTDVTGGPDLAAIEGERDVRIVRAVRDLRDAYRDDPKGLAALRYVLGTMGYEPKLSRAEVACLLVVSVDAIREHEPRVNHDLDERLRGIA